MTCFDEENFVITDSNIERNYSHTTCHQKMKADEDLELEDQVVLEWFSKCKDVENIANVEMQNSVSLPGLFG